MKKLIFILIITILISSIALADTAFSGTPSITGTMKLSDISGHWASVYIEKMMLKEAAFGFADSTFHPDSPITRLDVATMLVRLLGFTDPEDVPTFGYKLPFIDTASLPSEQQAYIGLADRFVLMRGDGASGTFRPSEPIKRQEAAVIITRVLALSVDEPFELSFSDASKIPDWAKEAIAAAVKSGLMNGYDDNTFRPDKAISRAEMTTLLARLDDYITVPQDENDLYGTVFAVKTSGNGALNVQLANGIMKNFKVKSDAKLFKGYSRIELKDVAANDKINMMIDGTGAIIYVKDVDELYESQFSRIYGRVVFIGKDGLITVSPVAGSGENVRVRLTGLEVDVSLNDYVLVVGKYDDEYLDAVHMEPIQ